MTAEEMNKELLEKLTAIREDLVAFSALAQVGDAKKLADLVKQKLPQPGLENSPMWRNYQELRPYMNADQEGRAGFALELGAGADGYLETGKDVLTGAVNRYVPLLLADLDDIAKKLEGAGP